MSFDRELWQRARPLFDELVELESGPRRVRLETIGRADSALRDAVERLLKADADSEGALRAYDFGLPRSMPSEAANPGDPLGLVGRTVSHFQVTGYLAAGGMGAVYRAEDLQLGRTVALKFPLPQQHMDHAVKERFVNEARSAAALDHPNLCAVYEVGESEYGVFLAMPLYPGETLRQRIARERALPAGEALRIIRQVATGLASAHEAGIVHRDLKPGNVMLLPDGTAKVLDFGLAKIRDVSLTRSRVALGTIGYVAPEQIRSEPVDARADIWSIGVMLYEMLTGTRPFQGEHEVSVIHSILHEQPRRVSRVNPSVLPEFDSVVDTLLQKKPDNRYRNAQELLDDLSALERGAPLVHQPWLSRRTTGRERFRRTVVPVAAVALLVSGALGWYVYQQSAARPMASAPATSATIAVLPFINEGGEPDDDYIASGISDELAALLGRTPGLRMAARASATALQARGLSPRDVGRQLGVAHLVQGRVRVAVDTVRLAVSVTRVADGATVWTRNVAAPVSEAIALERQVADGVLDVLHLRGAGVLTTSLPTADREAYQLYLQGKYAWTRERSRASMEEALRFYRAALDRDPQFAEAHSGIAAAYVNMANFGYMPSHEAVARAEVAAARALALDSSLADAHASRGFVLSARAQFAQAEASFQRAIALNPNSHWAHHYYAILLAMLNRLDEAKEATRRTLAIDPLSLPGNTMLGIEFAAEGRLELARTQLRNALQLSPGFPLTLYYLGAVEASLGEYEVARTHLEQAVRTAPDFPGVRAALAHVYGKLGRTADARRLLTESRNAIVDERTRLNHALALALHGPVDSAFAMLRTADWDLPTIVELRHSPLLRAFRSDPRYPQLLAGMGLRP